MTENAQLLLLGRAHFWFRKIPAMGRSVVALSSVVAASTTALPSCKVEMPSSGGPSLYAHTRLTVANRKEQPQMHLLPVIAATDGVQLGQLLRFLHYHETCQSQRTHPSEVRSALQSNRPTSCNLFPSNRAWSFSGRE
jgi:hypothetical protein